MQNTIKWILCVIALSLLSSSIAAQDRVEQSLSFHTGYFVPARETFRGLYKDSWDFSLQYERPINDRLRFGISCGYLWQTYIHDESNAKKRYTNLYALSSISYDFSKGKNTNWFIGGAIGANFRKIKFPIYMTDENGREVGLFDISVNDFGPSVNLMFGFRTRLSDKMFISPRLMFDFIYDSDADIGGFGNTGGLRLNLGIGRWL